MVVYHGRITIKNHLKQTNTKPSHMSEKLEEAAVDAPVLHRWFPWDSHGIHQPFRAENPGRKPFYWELGGISRGTSICTIWKNIQAFNSGGFLKTDTPKKSTNKKGWFEKRPTCIECFLSDILVYQTQSQRWIFSEVTSWAYGFQPVPAEIFNPTFGYSIWRPMIRRDMGNVKLQPYLSEHFWWNKKCQNCVFRTWGKTGPLHEFSINGWVDLWNSGYRRYSRNCGGFSPLSTPEWNSTDSTVISFHSEGVICDAIVAFHESGKTSAIPKLTNENSSLILGC